MARHPRTFIPGVPSHARLRGNDRQDIFRCDGDRLYFLQCLRNASARFDLAVHAYVLMTNHVHLLATAGAPPGLGLAVQHVGRHYVRYFNDRHSRTGTLFEGRYRANLVQADRYYYSCHRYIELNPVRARLVDQPGDHPWSSHCHYAQGRPDSLIRRHSLMASDSHSALFDREMPSDEIDRIRHCLTHGWVLGDPDYCFKVEAAMGMRLSPIGRGRGRTRNVNEAQQGALEV